MSNVNLTMKEVLLKYKSLDANIIHERNKLINDECLHNEICNILANQWQQQSLAQPIVCATLGGNNKLCSMIDEKTELMGQSPYWTWTKAQLKVNQQRDTIDLLLCDLVKAVMENEDTQIVIEREKTQTQTQTQTQNVNINSFLSAALGALIVNMFYYYFKY
jgi:hypothetical protein